MEACYSLGAIAAVIVTILLYVKVLPRKLDGTFSNNFVQFLHDFFHFKKLYLEEVLKFFFVLATVACVCIGAFLMLGYQEYWGYYATRKESTFLIGLAVLVGGPVSLRLAYEMLMMLILAVKNIMDINNKLPNKKDPEAETSAIAE